MSSLSLAFTMLAIISGVCLLGIAFDSGMYDYGPPKASRRAMTILTLATLLFTFIAILTSGKECNDYTASDYKNGYVPISCSTEQMK